MIHWDALGQVVVASLVFGAGVPALFALGLRGLFLAEGRLDDHPHTPAADAAALAPRRRALGVATVVVCWGLVAAAIVWGIVLLAAG